MAKKAGKRSKAAKRARPAAKKSARSKKTKAGSKKKSSKALKKSPLSKAELKAFRQMLVEKRRDLMGDMSGIRAEALRSRQGGGGDLSNMPTHLADLGSDNFEHEFTLGLLESERALLGEIEEALQRIDEGTYGVCLGTGKPITKSRLRARPWAKYCIEYARMIEKGLVRPGEPAEDQ